MVKQQGSGKTNLANEDEAYEAIFGGEFGSLEIGSYIGGDEGANSKDYTEHLPDAVDFEDEDELADDDDDLPEESDANLHPAMMTMGAYDDINENGAVLGIDSNSLNMQLPEINGDLSQQFILEDDGVLPQLAMLCLWEWMQMKFISPLKLAFLMVVAQMKLGILNFPLVALMEMICR